MDDGGLEGQFDDDVSGSDEKYQNYFRLNIQAENQSQISGKILAPKTGKGRFFFCENELWELPRSSQFPRAERLS